MKMLDKILVPIDFRGASDDVIWAAETLAKKFGSTIRLFHVLHTPAEAYREWEAVAEMAGDRASERLGTIAARLAERGVAVDDPLTVEGRPFDEIVRQAEQDDSNVVVLGRGSTRDGGTTPLGSTAEGVCRRSSSPVWLVAPGQTHAVTSILCAVDFSPASKRAMENAIHMARQFDASLVVVTVVPPPSALESVAHMVQGADDAVLRDQHEMRLERFLKPFDFHGLQWAAEVRSGDPAEEIISAASRCGANLVVMGSVGSPTRSRATLGEVAGEVIRALSCSVVTVKEQNAIRLQLEHDMADLRGCYQRGQQLLEMGFPQEAAGQFRLCLLTTRTFAPAWRSLADCFDRLGKSERAIECRDRAEEIEESFKWYRVQADVRRQQQRL